MRVHTHPDLSGPHIHTFVFFLLGSELAKQACPPAHLSMDSDGSWHSLGQDLQLSIMSVLKQRKDKSSLQAMMQTSRDLRLLASSLISSIEIRGAFALARYPKHAAAITSMRLCMRPSPRQVHMEPSAMISWLQSTPAISSRMGGGLAAVTGVRVDLPVPDEDDEEKFEPMRPAIMDNLITTIGRACPSLRSLHIDGIYRTEVDKGLVRAMFSAIGQHLPGIVELQLEVCTGTDLYDFNIAGIDWAACLPRGMEKFNSNVHLHHNLLQQLVQMPALVEVVVGSLGDDDVDGTTEVQSGGCAWRILRIGGLGAGFSSCKAFGRFSAAMPLLQLYCTNTVYWELDSISQAEGPTVAKAAAWLSQISNCPHELSIGWGVYIPDSISTVGVISALAPMSNLTSLQLLDWPVTERTLDELALALPNVSKLAFKFCSINSSAWLRMLSLASVTHLSLIRTPVTLKQVVAFTSVVLRPVTLLCANSTNQAGWDDCQGALMEQRRLTGLPPIEVIVSS